MAVGTRYQPQVGLRPTNQTGARVGTTAASFGAPVGRAMSNLADAGMEVAQAIDFRARLEDDAKAREAAEGYRARQRDIMRDPDAGFLNQTGANALDQRESLQKALDKARDEFGADLSERSKRAYEQQVTQLRNTAEDQAIGHESTESRNYVVNARQATVRGYVDDATTNWDDPELFEQNLAQAVAEQTALSRLAGADPTSTEEANTAIVSGALRQAAILRAMEDPGSLQAFMDENLSRLTQAHQHELDTQLKPLILEYQSNEILKQFVNPTATSEGPDPYLSIMTHVESSGNSNAANPDSSAVGSVQFLSGTYVSEVRKMQAAGLAEWADGMTTKQLLETRRDPGREREVFQFFRDGNQAQIRAAGLPVTKTTEYMWHFFGDGGGRALAQAAQLNPGMTAEALYRSIGADWNAVVKANRGTGLHAGTTAAEAMDWASGKMNDDGSRTDRNFFDEDAALQAAMAIEDPELQRVTVQRIEQLASLQQRQRDLQRTQATETAYDLWQTEGATSLPYDLRRQMGPGGYSAWQQTVRNETIGIDTTDLDTHELLTRMASQDPTTFASADLTAHYPNLSRADRQAFVQMQEAARAGIEGAPGAPQAYGMDFDAAVTATQDIYKAFVPGAGAPPSMLTQADQVKQLEFRRRLQQTMVEFFEKEGREPSQTELRQMATALTMPTRFIDTPGIFGRERGRDGSFFQIGSRTDTEIVEPSVKYGSIPIEDRARIAATLTALSDGVAPDPEDIVEYYENEMVVSLGGDPIVQPEDVPDWFMTEVKTMNPNATEKDAAAEYQSFMAFHMRQNPGVSGPMAASVMAPPEPGETATPTTVAEPQEVPTEAPTTPDVVDTAAPTPIEDMTAQEQLDEGLIPSGGIDGPDSGDGPDIAGSIVDRVRSMLGEGDFTRRVERVITNDPPVPENIRRETITRLMRDLEKLGTEEARALLAQLQAM